MAIATHPLDGTYTLDVVHSTVEFAVRHLELSSFRASFSDLAATLSAGGDGIAIEARVGVESVSIVEPPEFRDHVVHGDDFFGADSHPDMTFRSTGVALGDDGAVTVTGELTIRGISQPVVAHGTYRPRTQDPFGSFRVGLDLHATIDRRRFGMDWQLPLPDGGDALGWDVEITAQLELVEAS